MKSLIFIVLIKANLAGLQFADLIARPIGNKYLHKDSHDRSYEILRSKLRRDGFGRAGGMVQDLSIEMKR